MRRTLFAVAILAGCFGAPLVYAQDGRQFLQGILGGIVSEIDRQEQRRRIDDFVRRVGPFWWACESGDVAACHRAARFPLNPQGRALLANNLRIAVIQRQLFEFNAQECQAGSLQACDSALVYPFATDKAALIAWRATAVERAQREAQQHQERDRLNTLTINCRAGGLGSCDLALAAPSLNLTQRAELLGVRVELLKRQMTPLSGNRSRPQQHDPAAYLGAAIGSWLSSPWTNSTPSYPATVLVIFVATPIVVALFVLLRERWHLASPFLAKAASAFLRPMKPASCRESRAMRDDRETLVSSSRRSTGSAPRSDPGHVPSMVPGQDKMKVKIRRDQVAGLAGKVTFSVNFIAELSPEAREAVRRYRFGKTVLYQKNTKLDASMNIVRLLWRLFWLWITRKRWQITINDLVHGRTIACKDILEVLDVEEQIMGAAKSFASVLRAASWFDGEEIVEL